MSLLRALGRLFVYALAATLAAGPIVLAAALLPVPVWTACYLLAVLLVAAGYGWWRAAAEPDYAWRRLQDALVREQELAQRLDTRWDDDLCALIDFEENR